MRSLEESRVISCQIQYVPIKTMNVDEDVKRVLQLIDESGLVYQTGAMSTWIRGNPARLFQLLQELEKEMSDEKKQFTMTMILSNDCGCGQ